MKAPKPLQTLIQKLSQRLRDRMSKLSYRRFLFLIILFCCLLFVAILFLLPEEQQETVKQERQEQPKVDVVKVFTANRDIDPQTIIREDMLTPQELPKALVPDGAVTDSKKAINLPAAVPIQKGDVLTTKKFYSDIKMAGFPGKIPADCRAVSIAISDITGIAGFAKPGDYVDVMIISGKRGGKKMTGNILLQNVLLLGINKSAKVERPKTTPQTANKNNQEGQEGKGEGESKDQKKKEGEAEAEPGSQAAAQAMATATLALTPSDALRLAVASQNGTIYLALRPVVPKDAIVADTEYVYVDETQEDSSAHASAPAQTYTAPSPAPASTPNASVPLPSQAGAVNAQIPPVTASEDTVEIIRGVQSSMVNSR